ncbi:polymeric immunoglobulin receptor-like isoform X1 [Engystomops pustulosus]|uniref:polymeric immunoglobulin receptor-like isoform X1 n=2 Tax=Engystomops pustulosus TaxID=76066 RepID=UPI003AFA1E7D
MNLALFFFGLAFAIIQNVESDEIVCPKQVIGKVDGSVTITCLYSVVPKANRHVRKYLCLQGTRLGRCGSTVTSTSGFIHPNYVDRVSLEDDREGTIVMIISNLQKTDGGTYICGMNNDMNSLKAVFIVAITEDSTIPNEAQLLYGQVHGKVNFHCEFEDQYAEERKYLCKIEKNGYKNIIDSSGAIDPLYLGRIILEVDEQRLSSFTVRMIQLKKEDSGIFLCGVGNCGTDGDNTEFDLRINEDTDIPQESRSLSTKINGSVSAQCKYNPQKNYTLKFWCKWKDSACDPLIKSDGYVKYDFEGKLVLLDDPVNGTLHVLMNQITKKHEGWYWCVMTDGKQDQISTVQIIISEGNNQGLAGGKTMIVNKGETVQIPCYYPCRYKSYRKYWCKWNNLNCKEITSNVDDNENGMSVSCGTHQLVLTIESISLKDNGWYWCGVQKSGRYEETIAVQVIVEEPSGHVPNSEDRIPVDSRSNVNVVNPPSSSDNKQNSLLPVLLSICAAILVASAVFFIIRLKRRNNTDLVSVGSYRTNISMTDLDNVVGKENPAVSDMQETDISGSKDGVKMKKKGSQEDIDYSCFLIHQNGSPNEENTV